MLVAPVTAIISMARHFRRHLVVTTPAVAAAYGTAGVRPAAAAADGTAAGTLLIFGTGFIGEHVARLAAARGYSVLGTTRRVGAREVELSRLGGVRPLVFQGTEPMPEEVVERHFPAVTHVLSTVPPSDGADPVLAQHATALQTRMPQLRWIGHLSTAAVYGAAAGDVVDSSTEARPGSVVARLRLLIEDEWAQLASRTPIPCRSCSLVLQVAPPPQHDEAG